MNDSGIVLPIHNTTSSHHFHDNQTYFNDITISSTSLAIVIEPWCRDLHTSDLVNYYSVPTRYAVAAVFLTILVFNVVGNAIVIFVVVVDRRLRRITSGLIISMAAADILAGLSAEMHGVILMFDSSDINMSHFTCSLSMSADIYFSLCELFHIVFLSLEKYFAICHPFLHQRFGKKFLTIIIVLAWIIPLVFSFLPILLFWHLVGQDDIYHCLDSLNIDQCVFFPNKTYSCLLFFVMFVLPTILLFMCYFKILRVAFRHSKFIGEQRSVTSLQTTRDTAITRVDYEINKKETIPLSVQHNVYHPEDKAGSNNTKPHEKTGDGIQHDEMSFMERAVTSNKDDSIIPTEQLNTELVDKQTRNACKQNMNESHRNLQTTHCRTAPTGTGCRLCRAVFGFDVYFKPTRTIMYVCLCLLVTWTPYWTLILISPFVGPLNVPRDAILASLWLFSFGSAINPFVYYFCTKDVRKGIVRVAKKLCIKYLGCINGNLFYRQ